MLSETPLRTRRHPILGRLELNEHDLALPYLSRSSGVSFESALLAQLFENDPTYVRSVQQKNSRSSRFGPNALPRGSSRAV